MIEPSKTMQDAVMLIGEEPINRLDNNGIMVIDKKTFARLVLQLRQGIEMFEALLNCKDDDERNQKWRELNAKKQKAD